MSVPNVEERLAAIRERFRRFAAMRAEQDKAKEATA
jgi:uncharacterized small protein (DUF1192 family)